jgi:hypothetical protein
MSSEEGINKKSMLHIRDGRRLALPWAWLRSDLSEGKVEAARRQLETLGAMVGVDLRDAVVDETGGAAEDEDVARVKADSPGLCASPEGTLREVCLLRSTVAVAKLARVADGDGDHG